MCKNEVEDNEWRIRVVAFICDHICPSETYRLDENDLAFGELLPEKPGWMQQEEYERENAVGFELKQLTREMRWLDRGPSLSDVNGQPVEA